ncbi:MAG: hypothetical protein IKL05_02335 [Clostridia bacterium]|nr:hypothetical protein [Clostridia bacterium]
MKLEDFSISNFNDTMQADVSKQTLNFCKAIILSHKKASLTLAHKPQHYFSQYATLNKDLTVCYKNNFSTYYYGVSPKIDSFSVIDAISNLSFKSTEGLNAYISEHCDEFMLHEDQALYLLDVAKLILLTIASKYGVKFKDCEELKFLSADDSIFSTVISYEQTEKNILLHGCPCFDLIERLKKYRFVNKNGVWQISDQGISFSDIYANKSNIKLLVGRVFYSGVLLKPLEINKQKYSFENSGISNYQLIYERSSFATVCAFDDHYVNHPLLKESRPNLEEFFNYDDTCKLHLFENLSIKGVDDEQILAYVNEYIKRSYNVNQIGVSSNIKTPKNEILFGLRASENIDDGALYPSVNGNAEVYDENVQFYNISVYEDQPTVYLHKKRSDLLGEIAREAYGELNITSAKESWSCYGMIISGNLPKAIQDNTENRRCHFNVLFENEVNETLYEIESRYRKASEAFENKKFAAIVIKYYKTRFHSLWGGVIHFLQRLLQSKDFVESILLLFVSFMSIKTIDLSLENISSLLSFLFASIILLTTVIKVVQHAIRMFRNAKNTKKICIYGSMSYSSLCHKISKVMKMKYHPAAYASLKMHIENLVYSDLEDKE